MKQIQNIQLTNIGGGYNAFIVPPKSANPTPPYPSFQPLPHTHTPTHTHTHTAAPLSSIGYLNKIIKADESITQSHNHISQRLPCKIFNPEGEIELLKMKNFLQSKSS